MVNRTKQHPTSKYEISNIGFPCSSALLLSSSFSLIEKRLIKYGVAILQCQQASGMDEVSACLLTPWGCREPRHLKNWSLSWLWLLPKLTAFIRTLALNLPENMKILWIQSPSKGPLGFSPLHLPCFSYSHTYRIKPPHSLAMPPLFPCEYPLTFTPHSHSIHCQSGWTKPRFCASRSPLDTRGQFFRIRN